MEGVEEGGEVKGTEGCPKGPSLFHLFNDAFIHTAARSFKCIDHWNFFNTIILDAKVYFYSSDRIIHRMALGDTR